MKFLLSSLRTINLSGMFLKKTIRNKYVSYVFISGICSIFYDFILLKIIIDYSAHEYNFLLNSHLIFYIYLYLPTRPHGWVMPLDAKYFWGLFDGRLSLISAGLKNYLNLKKDAQSKLEQ